MSQLGMKCSIKGNVSHQFCRECSLSDHPCEFPTDFLEMMREENDTQPDRTEFTPSTLLECPRRVALRTSNDYYVDPAHAWNLLRGDMVHKLIETRGVYPPDSVVDTIREVRLYTTIETKYGPQKFSGKMDLIEIQKIEEGVAHIKIVDYKTKRSITHDLTAADRKHQMQLNMYALLAERELAPWMTNNYFGFEGELGNELAQVERVEVTELEVVYVDMSKVRRFTTIRPLQTKGKLLNRATWEYDTLELEQMHLLPREVIEAWIVQEIEVRIDAKTTLPPPLEGDEAKLCSFCPVQPVCFKLAGKSL